MLFRPGRLFLVAAAFAAIFGRVASADTTFYEAYQNGLAHEKEGAFREARDSFLRAAELRPECARRVKAYGLNFIEPYDPAIHLARMSLRLGLLDEARQSFQIAQTAGVSPSREISALAAEIEKARLAVAVAARLVTATVGLPAASPTRAERTAPLGVTPQPPSPVPLAVAPPTEADSRGPVGTAASRPGESMPAPSAPSRTARPKEVDSSGRTDRAESPSEATPIPAKPAQPRSDSRPLQGTGAPAGTQGPPGKLWSPGSIALLASGLGLFVLVATRAALVLRARRLGSPATLMNRPSSSSSVSSTNEEANCSLATSCLSPGMGSSPSGSRAGSASTAVGARPLREGTDTRFGAYVLEGILGRGGMGTTYVARRLRDGFQVALKVPHEHILEDPEFVERFLREGALGALLRHPNIVRIYEAGEHDERPFIAMELVPGTTLERVVRKEQRLPLSRALHIARGIALALDYAHMKGIVHRDLKPENVMVLPDGEVKVMDYGIARRMDVAGLTATDAYLGTPNYSAPESLVPPEVGPQSDLYSLGVILFRMLSGELPFHAPTAFELLHKHAYEPLPPLPPELGVLPEVYGLLLELTAKSKTDRYATAEAFLRDLDQILNRL